MATLRTAQPIPMVSIPVREKKALQDLIVTLDARLTGMKTALAARDATITALSAELKTFKSQASTPSPQPQHRQRYARESQQRLACKDCGYIACRCAIPPPGGLDAIVALQAARRLQQGA